MPGIVGLVTRKPREQAEAELLRMLATMRHEEFYTDGTWIDEALGVYVGWTARRGAFDDGMPLEDERGDRVLIFSGEEYSGLSDRRACIAAASQAKYLIDCCDDPSFPATLNGQFHGLVIDRRLGTAQLFTDRYNMHRVYYHETPDAFYFAAEAKAILAALPHLRRLRPRSVGELVTCGCVLENRTLFEGIDILPCAAKWTFSMRSGLDRKCYFDPTEWEQQPRLNPAEYYEALRTVFSQNLSRYFAGRERAAMSLTGGLDTRMIMAWHSAPPGSLPCYTFGGMIRDNEDVRVAREVAAACHQPHQVIAVNDAMLGRFAQYAERSIYLTDGCVGVGLSPDLYVYEQARRIAPVRITGNYGGEVLRAVVAFKPVQPRPNLFSEELYSSFEQARQTYAAVLDTHPVSFSVFRQAPWYHHGVLSLEQTQLTVRTPYLDNDLVRTVLQAPESALRSNDACLRLIAEGSPELALIPTDRGLGGRQGISEAVHHRWSEFLFKAEYAFDYGMPQPLARINRVLSPLRIERLFLGRHKSYHFRMWYRDVLASYVREVLLSPTSLSRPWVVRATVQRIVDQHLRGERNYTTEIHKLLTLELIQRRLVDLPASS